MKYTILFPSTFGLAVVFAIIVGSPARAGDCPAGQYRQNGPFGVGWTCLPMIGGPVGQVGEVVKTAVSPIVTGHIEALNTCLSNIFSCNPSTIPGITPIDEITIAGRCLQLGANCPADIIKGLPAYAIRPAIIDYLNFLHGQADGHWKRLPPAFIASFQQNYPEINLSNIEYAENINTSHGQNMTVLNDIYFVKSMNFGNQQDIHLALHELQHAVQYSLKGGLEPFISEYALQGADQIMAHRGFDIHDFIGLESDAINKSETIVNQFGWPFVFSNNCDEPLRLALVYQNESGENNTVSWTEFPPGSTQWIMSDGQYVHTTVGDYYYYAESTAPDSTVKWTGATNFQVDDTDYPFAEKDESGSSPPYFGTSFTCSSS